MPNTNRSPRLFAWALLTLGAVAPAIPALAAPRACAVTFAVDVTEQMGTIDFTVDYSQVQGNFSLSGGSASCTTFVKGGRIFSKSTCDGSYESCQWGADRRLTVDQIFDSAVVGPTDLMICAFLSDQDPSAGNFAIGDATASDFQSGSALKAFPPHVFVRVVECQ